MNKNILILFGLLDLFSFVVTYRFGLKVLEHLELSIILTIPEILLIVSLLASGILSIMRKKISLKIYYFQFPIRVIYMILTFGFLVNLFELQYNSVSYKALLIMTFLLEIARLTMTIRIQKKEFRK